MKSQITEVEIDRSEGLVESEFGISSKSEDIVHLLHILRDKLYSDKPYAVVREYSTNAIDAHMEAGIKDTPIQVTLPTQFDQALHIRDFGVGLSEFDVRELYVKYGASTKRQSNDSIGQLGLGCKSGFAYGDSFMVVSFYGGKKMTFSAYLDESQIGHIALMAEEETTEPTGIEIIIPIRRGDIQTFRNIAIRTLKFFEVRPDVRGCVEWESTMKAFDEGDLLRGKTVDGYDWVINKSLDQAYAVMGNIAYPIEDDKLQGVKPRDEQLFRCPMYIRFPIGALSIAANRESLEYTPATQKAILERAKTIHNIVKREFEQRLAACTNLIEAKLLWRELNQSSYANHHLSNYMRDCISRDGVEWQGHTLDNYFFQIQYDRPDPASKDDTSRLRLKSKLYHVRMARGRKSNTVKRFREEETNSIEVAHYNNYKDHIFFVEKDISDRWVRRTETLYQERLKLNPTSNPMIYVFEWESPEEREYYYKRYELDRVDVVKVSTLVPAKIERFKRGPLEGARAKHKEKAFMLDMNVAQQHMPVRSEYWQTVEVDLDQGGIYFELDRFYIMHNGAPAVVGNLMGYRGAPFNLLKLCGYDMFKSTLYGFKPAIRSKLDPGKWERFEDYLVRVISTFLIQEKIAQSQIDYDQAVSYFNNNIELLQKGDWSGIRAKSSLRRYVDTVVAMHTGSTKFQVGNLAPLVEFGRQKTTVFDDLKPTHDIEPLRLQVLKDYPIFTAFEILGNGSRYAGHHIEKPAHVTQILDYVRLRDRRRK